MSENLGILGSHFLEFLRAQAKSSAGVLGETDLWLEARTGIPGMNRLALKRQATAQELAALARYPGSADALLVVLPQADHPGLGDTLSGLGFTLARDTPQLVWTPAGRGGRGEATHLVQGDDERELWRQVASCAYPFGEKNTRAARTVLGAMHTQTACRFYLHFDGSTAVSCALTLVQPTGASLYWVASAPQWRRRGHASAMLQAVQNDLASLGVPLVGLQSSDEGAPLYRKLGFVETGRLRAWERRGGHEKPQVEQVRGETAVLYSGIE